MKKLTEEAEKAFEVQIKKKVSIKKTQVTNTSPSSITVPKMSYKKYTLEQKTSIVNLVPYMNYTEIEKKYGVDESILGKAWSQGR